MSILDKMKVETMRRNLRRPEDPYGVEGNLTQVKINDAKYNGFTYEQGFITSFTAKTMWYANDAQFRSREDLARKELLYYMYGPVINRLNEIRARAYDRDYREVLRVVDEIHKELLE